MYVYFIFSPFFTLSLKFTFFLESLKNYSPWGEEEIANEFTEIVIVWDNGYIPSGMKIYIVYKRKEVIRKQYGFSLKLWRLYHKCEELDVH